MLGKNTTSKFLEIFFGILLLLALSISLDELDDLTSIMECFAIIITIKMDLFRQSIV